MILLEASCVRERFTMMGYVLSRQILNENPRVRGRIASNGHALDEGVCRNAY